MPTRGTKPIIIAAGPSSTTTHTTSNLSPSTPPSPKTVRFAPRSDELPSRPATSQEAWSLYHFENHAHGCAACHKARRSLLCDTGYHLAQDVAVHVRLHAGELCSTRPDDDGKWLRVEIPHGYNKVKTLLGAEAKGKKVKKSAPVVSYEDAERRRSSSLSPRRRDREHHREKVTVEPSRSSHDEKRSSAAKPKAKTQHYATVEVKPITGNDRIHEYEQGGPVRLPERPKRGSLYEADMKRPRKEFRIEERAPLEKKVERGRDREREREREERREMRRRERERERESGRGFDERGRERRSVY